MLTKNNTQKRIKYLGAGKIHWQRLITVGKVLQWFINFVRSSINILAIAVVFVVMFGLHFQRNGDFGQQ